MLGHSVDKYVTGSMLETSNAHGWTNLLAERWSHAPGELPSLVPRETEIAILLRGRSVVDRIGGGMRQYTQARPGTIWLCPAGIEEEFINVTESIDDCLHIFLSGQPFDETILREHDIDPARVELRYESIASDPFIEFIATEILKEMAEESPAGRLLMETLAISLSAHLIKRYSATDLRPKQPSAQDRPLDQKRLSRVKDYIDAHLENDFTVVDLATIACMSVAHFARSFRAATGKTPHNYVRDLRLELAKQRLTRDDSHIAEIAFAAGFSSQANFTKAFRSATGLTPAKFRVMTALRTPQRNKN
ncbi:helix-turn-helix domain-containing protein [Agrobacterium vitis]